MKIAVTGSTGLIGNALIKSLLHDGHTVTRLVRRLKNTLDGTSSIEWSPETGQLDGERLEGHDAVIHLAGENVSDGRWTEEKKNKIRDSRVQGTKLIAEAIARLKMPPLTLLSASAIGFYGDRGAERLTEDSGPGTDFLAGVCRAWERETKPAEDAGIRVVHVRFGVVLSQEGGALAKMLTPFKMGVGGKIGSGEQYLSWITLDDAVKAVEFTLNHDSMRGPVNIVGPEPVTNAEFTEMLGEVLSRPTFFSVPAFVSRLAFGEMADALLLSGMRVYPERLRAAGFTFRHPQLKDALRYLLNKN